MDTSDGTIRTVIVDDHAVFAEALAAALGAEPDLTVDGIAGTIEDGLELVARAEPHVVLMDVRLPDGDGTDAVATIRDHHESTTVVVLTATLGIDTLSRAVAAGAAGFLSKGDKLRAVVDAVRQVHAGAVLFDAATLGAVASHLRVRRHEPGADLTTREREILQLVASGASTEAIAASLFLSPHTVRNHVRNVLTKLQAHSKLEGVAIALRHDLIDLDRL